MSRPRRKRRPPGNVLVCCTGRGKHDLVRLRTLQLRIDGDRVRVYWDQREGAAPETGFRADGDVKTFEFQCGTCRRNPKFREDRLVEIARVLAEHQGIRGDDNTPIVLDISMVEKA